jgi:hypothetical protein
MTSVAIYYKNKKLREEIIHREFYIVEDPSGQLFWYEKDPDVSRSGTYKVWIQSIGHTPRILFVLPDWQLIIDDVWMEKKFYSNIENLEGKKLELRNKEYKFVFQID